jgi:small conductance mechanosensitive channel
MRKVMMRVLAKFSENITVNRIITLFCSTALFLTGIFICLGILKLDKTVTSLLAGAGIIGLALSFAFQDLAVNLVSGIMIAFRKPIQPGDLIETNGFFGTVTSIELRAIHLRTQQGQNVVIPSREIFQKPVTNYTITGERRVDIAFNVSPNEDLEKTRALCLEAVMNVAQFDDEKKIELFYESFNESGISVSLRFWLSENSHLAFLQARSEAIIRINKTLKANKIQITFPTRSLDFNKNDFDKLLQKSKTYNDNMNVAINSKA